MRSTAYSCQPLFVDVVHILRQRQMASRESDWHKVVELAQRRRCKICTESISEMQGLALHDLFILCPDLFRHGVLMDGPAW